MLSVCRRVLLAILSSVMTFTGAAGSEKEAAIRVGVEPIMYLPHYGLDNGEYVGFAREVLDQFAQDAGLELEYHPIPVRRLMGALLSGDVDLKYPDNPSWSREMKMGKVHYSQPVVEYVDGLSVKAATPDREVKMVGIVIGFTPTGLEDRVFRKEIDLLEVGTLTSLIQMTDLERVDAAYGNLAVVQYLSRHVLAMPGALVPASHLPVYKGQYHLSSVSRPDLVKRFDQWLTDSPEKLQELKMKFDLSLLSQ